MVGLRWHCQLHLPASGFAWREQRGLQQPHNDYKLVRSTAGGTNTATMTLTSAVKPASGQTFTWTPPPVRPAALPAPRRPLRHRRRHPHQPGLVSGCRRRPAPTSYDVYFGTSATPPFVANVAASPYNPGALAYSTLYYWQIVPKNASGRPPAARSGPSPPRPIPPSHHRGWNPLLRIRRQTGQRQQDCWPPRRR